MSDIIDVMNTLVALSASAVYPNGTGQPSVVNARIILYPGWPDPATLDADLKIGKSHVSVFPMPGMEANTTRFLQKMQEFTDIPVAELTLTVSANQITVGGSINVGEAACANVNYLPYSYGVLITDTLATVAAGLAAKIPNAVAVGTVITITNVFNIFTTVSVPVLMQQEIARQTRIFMITAWCQTPSLRDRIAAAIDVSLKQQVNKRILLPDNTLARLKYRGTLETDALQKQGAYRRDLRYEVEYVTTSQEIDNTVANLVITTSANGGSPTTINI